MPPVLETARLRLRPLSFGDADFIVRLLNDPCFLRHIGDKGVRNAEDAREYIRTGPMASYERFGFGLSLVERKEDGAPHRHLRPAPARGAAGPGQRGFDRGAGQARLPFSSG